MTFGFTKMSLIGLLQKEWIKLRVLGLIPFVVMAFALVDYYLTIKTIMTMHGAAPTWGGLISKEQVLFDKLIWVFVGSGAFLAVVGIYPECTDGRIRLSMHLPLQFTSVFAIPVAVGVFLTFLIGIESIVGLEIIHSLIGFPTELSTPMLLTLLPWILAGMVTWAAVAGAITEASRIRKIAILLLGYAFVSFLSIQRGYDDMGANFWLYTLASLPWVFVPYIGAMRFKG